MDYKDAGVDIEAGDSLVDWLKNTQPKSQPHSERLLSGIGGFASLFKADFPKMKEPCLVTCTDGVGTKLKIACHFKDFSTIGQDLVAMCVNDLICAGAAPLLFLDYYATGKLQLEEAKEFLSGVRNACINSDCLLIGGETAEMPGVYQNGDFDCAGFSVGVVDKDKSLGKNKVKAGFRLIGVESHGFHSNGYSLIRKMFAEDLDDWKDTLLRPTALYVDAVKDILLNELVGAMAHITGGGIDNILRVTPDNMVVELEDWTWPEEFKELQKRSGLAKLEMLKTFNCGIGLVLVCPEENVDLIKQKINKKEFKTFELGKVRTKSLDEIKETGKNPSFSMSF